MANKAKYEDIATFKRSPDGTMFYKAHKYGWTNIGICLKQAHKEAGDTATIYFDENMTTLGMRYYDH